jgi:hypothetical protein
MAATVDSVPPLAMGDTLTREEFIERWEANPRIKRAELIGGVVYMPSPVSIDHGDNENTLGGWLANYKVATPGCAAANNATVFLLDDCPQPDGHLRLLPEAGGTSRIEGKFLHGPPELAAEMCMSSAVYDLHQKLDLYRQAGVKEYLAVLMYEQEIRWHRLVGDSYRLLVRDAQGVWRSRVFPGLWLDGPALLRGDAAAVMAKLQEGIAAPEHAAFVKKLARRMGKRHGHRPSR